MHWAPVTSVFVDESAVIDRTELPGYIDLTIVVADAASTVNEPELSVTGTATPDASTLRLAAVSFRAVTKNVAEAAVTAWATCAVGVTPTVNVADAASTVRLP